MAASKRRVRIISDLIIAGLMLAGLILMLTNRDSGTGLTADGIENLKFYTVLSNLFCGITALASLIYRAVTRKDELPSVLLFLKLASASAVGLTFLVIAAFLGPIYGHLLLYRGSNLVFHLLEPLAGMADLCTIKTYGRKIPFWWTLAASIPTVIYGGTYLINILINGVGTWPEGNDWYGFLNWGMPVGIGIFAGITVSTFVMALILRAINKAFNRR